MIPTPKLAELVLKQDAERAEVQEKLVALVTAHHEELGALLKTLPDLKREALENINARLDVVVSEALQKSLAAVEEKESAIKTELGELALSVADGLNQSAAQAQARAEAHAAEVAALVAQGQATRDEINALLAQLDQRQTESLTALARSLSGIAEKHARAMLASDENKETIRAAFAEHSKPILAALESKGGSFIDIYQGEFIAGKSTALRGQIWTYFGNTLLCTADTNQAPQYYDLSDSWALLAAKGAGGSGGGASTGSAGDVVGPSSSTDGAPALYDGVTGKLLKVASSVPVAFGGTGATSVLGAQQALNPLTKNTQTDSYTLALTDSAKLVQMNKGTANTLTVPKNSSVAFPVGTVIVCEQLGAGLTTVSPVDGDVTINSRGAALKSGGQFAMWTLTKTDTNVWNMCGDITA